MEKDKLEGSLYVVGCFLIIAAGLSLKGIFNVFDILVNYEWLVMYEASLWLVVVAILYIFTALLSKGVIIHCLYLFFSKSRLFPRVVSMAFIAILINGLLSQGYSFLISLYSEHSFESKRILGLVLFWLVSFFIWQAYSNKSERVRKVFMGQA
jgi:Protein of unknown function (DUF2569)